MNEYPPEFYVGIDTHLADVPVLVLSCLSCGVHHTFANGTSLDRMNDEASVHSEMHLMRAIYDV